MSEPAVGDDPLVSVVLPTYDRPEMVREGIRSVLEQTYEPIELVVVDDCSPTPVEPELRGMDLDGLTDVQWICHEENRGANAARNTGIRHASGEFVALLDDDDRWMPRKVEKQVHRFRDGGSDLGVVTVGSLMVDENGERIGVALSPVEGDATILLLLGAEVGSFSRVMVRSSVIERAGMLDKSFPSWQDREWYLRLSRHCTFASINELLVKRRIATHDQISDDFEAKRDVSYPGFLKKHRSFAAEHGWLVERRFVATLSRTVGFSGLSNGHYRDAIKYLLIALAYYPLHPKTYIYLALALGGPLTFVPARRLKRAISGFGSVE